MDKISIQQYEAMVSDVDSDEKDIIYYSILDDGDGGFDFLIKPDPAKVDISDLESKESAMTWANNWDRRRRQKKFWRRTKAGEQLPILVSEGDSWFQYPLRIDDVIDHLKANYLIYSVGAAGDTLENMVGPKIDDKKNEYMIALRKLKSKGLTVSGFMFSGAGNDIIGGDKKTKKRTLLQLLEKHAPGMTTVKEHINHEAKTAKLTKVKKAYQEVISEIRKESGFEKLPIFIHGYDHVFPFPYHGEEKDGFNKRKRKWLGEPLDEKGILDIDLRRAIITSLLNELHAVMQDVVSSNSDVYHIDCRGAMPHVSDWNDEIHGTSLGFAKVATRFRSTMDSVLKGPGLLP